MQTGDGLLVRLNPVAAGLSPNTLIGLCEAALAARQRHRRSHGARQSADQGADGRDRRWRFRGDVDALGIAVRTGVPVETGPLAGLDPQEIADPTPLAERIRDGIAAAGLAARLGPKVSVVVDGGGQLGHGRRHRPMSG